jgi:inner membrane protein
MDRWPAVLGHIGRIREHDQRKLKEIFMPTIITHSVIAVSAGKIFVRKKMPLRFWILSVVCSIIPDADVLAFSFGIPYGNFLGHRGFFHSIFFALILSLCLAFVFFNDYKPASKKWWKYTSWFFLISASHGILDAFTNGGRGIALLSPFNNTRYFSPWTPIEVSPIGIGAFISRWGLRVLTFEVIYIWLPLLTFVIIVGIFRKKFPIRSENLIKN